MKDRFRVYLSLTLLYAAFIFYISSSSNPIDSKAVVHFIEPIFKTFERNGIGFLLYPFYIFIAYPNQAPHLVYFAGFGFVLYFTLKNSPYQGLRDHACIFAVIIGTLYGASDEFHQSFVPGRHATLPDLLADSIGLIIAQTIIFIKDKLYFKK
ncbi:MAG: VanZ family protein [Candidatus Methanoperedens sp.]|nr:VanZ family protein [Candidatus Methanoperedens sp.]